jgi:hypothetical protein
MVERALKLKERVDLFCLQHGDIMHGSSGKKARSEAERVKVLKNDALTSDDWQALTEILGFLKKFYELTKRAEGAKVASDRGVLSEYLATLNILLKHTREARDEYNSRANNPELISPSVLHLRTCIVNCWTKLDEYFAIINDTPAHYASIVTTPHMKWRYFQRAWKDAPLWKEAVAPETWLPEGKTALYSLWDEYKTISLPGIMAGSKRARSPDEFERETDMTQWDEDDLDELEVWLQERPFPLKDIGETLPQFWLRQHKNPKMYRLAQLGLDMASIPAMSSDCERVFSQSKLLITGQRNRLKADIIEATQCLRMWLIEEQKARGAWKGRGNWTTPLELYNNSE